MSENPPKLSKASEIAHKLPTAGAALQHRSSATGVRVLFGAGDVRI